MSAAWVPAATQTSPPQPQEHTAEVVVSASRRPSDAAVTARVVQTLQDDHYLFADHISVVTEEGVVRLRGVVTDVSDLYRALELARRVAGSRQVRNEMELITDVECHD